MDNTMRKGNSGSTSSSSSSSGTSSNSHSSTSRSHDSSTTDTKTPKKSQRDQKLSRSFLHCIGKHLGRHFLHHHHHHQQQHRHRHSSDPMYNSQDDVRSSSTDSFSLSFERGSHADCPLTGSNIELVGGAEDHHKTHTSSTSTTGSPFSAALCTFDVNVVDLYDDDEDDDDDDDNDQTATAVELDRIYRRTARALSNSSGSDDSRASDSDRDNSHCHSDSDADDENAATDEPDHQRHQQMCNKAPAAASSTAKRLHLSRISISSSVSRMLHHFSSANSMRSLSCSSTPLRCVKEPKHQKTPSASGSANKSGPLSASNGQRNSGASGARANATASASAAKKKEKKQQSILRPPIHYVYMKGMSGLYSRVPRYSVCCPYAMQQIA